MYQDIHNAMLKLLEKTFISKICFSKSGEIEVKFTFIQNKVSYKSFDDLLEAIEIIEDLAN